MPKSIKKYISELVFVCLGGILLGLYILGISFLPETYQLLFSIAILCPLVAMLVGDLRKVLLTIMILGIPFQLSHHFYRQEEFANLGAVGGVTLTTTSFCLVILYSLWIFKLLNKSACLPQNFFRMILPLSTYLLAVIISGICANNLLLYSFQIELYIQVFLMYVYIVGTVKNKEEVLFIVKILIFGACLESLIIIMLFFKGQSFQFAGLSARIDEDMRIGGTVGSPINAAVFFSMILTPIYCIALARIDKYYKGLASITFGLGIISLLFTFSRGGWLAFLTSFGFFYFITWRRSRLSLIPPLIIAILISVLIIIFSDKIVNRVSDMDTVATRHYLNQIAFRMISENPLLGIGANNFASEIDRFTPSELQGRFLYVVHNQYLLVWSETGIGGLLAFFWFLLSTIRRGWQCWKIQDDLLSPLALAILLAIIGSMEHMYFDIFHSRVTMELLCLFAALITSMKYIGCKQSL